jgi:outer membrane immunogenic protein
MAGYDWTGAHVGVNAGFGFGGSDQVTIGNNTSPDIQKALNDGAIPKTITLRREGFIGGGQAGYDWQVNSLLVIGVEGDLDGADIGGSNSVTVPPSVSGLQQDVTTTVKQRMDFFGTVRGRAGIVVAPSVLLYGTGGFAFDDESDSFSAIEAKFPHETAIGSRSVFETGWVAGAGVEWAFAQNWSVKAEYLHYDLGTDNVKVVPGTPPGFALATFHKDGEIVRAGLNYHFATPVAVMIAPPPPPPVAVPMAAPPRVPRNFTVFFNFDRYNLTAEGRQVVDEAAHVFKSNGVAHIDLTGYTDLAGSVAYNLKLSQRRADTVTRYLVELGVPRGDIGVYARGKANPRVPTPDGVREPQNRRVEIIMP